MQYLILLFAFAISEPVQPKTETAPPPPPPKVKQTPDGPEFPSDAPESYFIDVIKTLREPPSRGGDPEAGIAKFGLKRSDLMSVIDEFLKRFPKSSFREDAILAKLATLAQYARIHPEFAHELLKYQEDLAKENPSQRIREESDFYALQAFVLAARAENMPEDRRLQGAVERYEAFLSDYPKSEHRPVMWASLIRNLLAMKKLDRASAELQKLSKEFPDNAATKRAAGEVYQAQSLGREFAFVYETSGGKSLDTRAHLGKVVIIHFWASWNEDSVKDLPKLIKLREEFKDADLQLFGINVDSNSNAMKAATDKHPLTWPQFTDNQGLDNEALIGTGVTKLPTYLLIDRKGVLRSVDPGDKLADMVKELVSESPK